ncbi:MAG TPA: hypothetical protein PKY31_06575 [Spirochaetota bacterium]|nr:hypothetical protein [Spirochaetota bacterium]
MKKIVTAVFAIFLISLSSAVPVSAGQFGDLLIELETSVFYNKQSDEWRGRRDAWMADIRSAGDNINSLKRLLVEFETHLKFEAQTFAWKSRRASWLRSVNSATTIRDLTRQMITCETAINYSSQAAAWRSRRADWLRRARAI